jgi:hypothetical protein
MNETVNHKRAPLTIARWRALLVIVLSMVVLAALNLGWTSYVDNQRDRAEREADRRWCSLLSTLDNAYRDTPPTNPVGIALAREVRSLIESTGC